MKPLGRLLPFRIAGVVDPPALLQVPYKLLLRVLLKIQLRSCFRRGHLKVTALPALEEA